MSSRQSSAVSYSRASAAAAGRAVCRLVGSSSSRRFQVDARLVDVAQLVLVQLGGVLEQLAAQRQIARIGGEERLFPRRRQLRLPAEQHRQPLDVVADVLVGRIDAQRLAPRRQRQLPRAQPLLLQLGQLRQQRRRVVPLGRLALRAEHQRQLGPRLVLAIERLERLGDALAQLGPLHQRLEPLARAFVARLDRQRLLEEIGGAARRRRAGWRAARRGGRSGARATRACPSPRRPGVGANGMRRANSSSSAFQFSVGRVEPLERAEGPLRCRDRAPGSRRSRASPPADRRARPRRDR